jgi:hypothetical protein
VATKSKDIKTDQYSDAEARSRFEAALRGARAVGHKTFEESKVGKPRVKRAKSPGARKPKSQAKNGAR